MRGSGAALRSVANITTSPTSKIPHIEQHIHGRRITLGAPKQKDNIHRRHNQHQSTLASSRDFGATENGTKIKRLRISNWFRDGGTIPRSEAINKTLPAPEENAVDFKDANMFSILEEGLPERILSGLMSHSIGTPFIEQAPDQLFNKALLMLDPVHFLDPFKAVSDHANGFQIENTIRVKSINHRLTSFAFYLDRIVVVRRESGNRLNLVACNHLLKCAASMGDGNLAESILKVIMPEDGVQPDLQSYNHFCRARIWAKAFMPKGNYSLRVLPRILQLRAARKPPESLSGHKTVTSVQGVKGIRQEILDVFTECTSRGLSADEAMFTNLMTAMGREGDLDGVKSVLKSVWNINVDLLGAYDEEEIESPTFYEIDTPLRPSQALLYTVAHIFGSNNDIHTAYSLVDFISRNYDLNVSERVWDQLCEWAFVLSRRRSPAEQKQKRHLGNIPQANFAQIVEVVSDEPHNVLPTSTIHWMLIRAWRDQKHLDKTVHHVQQLKLVVDEQHVRMKSLVDEVLKFARTISTTSSVATFTTSNFYDLRQRYMLQYLEFLRDLQFINIAVNRHLLTVKGWSGSGKLAEWERRRLPDLIATFKGYLPEVVKYEMQTGMVELMTKYKRRAKSYETHRLDYQLLPRIMNALDTDDHTKLVRRMQTLSGIAMEVQAYCANCGLANHTHERCVKTKGDASVRLDYQGETDHLRSTGDSDTTTWIFNRSIPTSTVPFSFDPGAELEYAKPRLPFQ